MDPHEKSCENHEETKCSPKAVFMGVPLRSKQITEPTSGRQICSANGPETEYFQTRPGQRQSLRANGHQSPVESCRLSRFQPQGTQPLRDKKVDSSIIQPERPLREVAENQARETREVSSREPQWLTQNSNLVWKDFSIVANHLRDLTADFQYKRETLFLSIGYLTDYLKSDVTVTKHDLLLLGVASLSAAAKFQETHRRNHAQIVCDERVFTCEELQKAEAQLLVGIGFHLYADTPRHWLDTLMSQWDGFITAELNSPCAAEVPMVVFRAPTRHAAARFYETYAVLDVVYLDPQAYSFGTCAVAAAVFYVKTVEFLSDPRGCCFLGSVRELPKVSAESIFCRKFLELTLSQEEMALIESAIEFVEPFKAFRGRSAFVRRHGQSMNDSEEIYEDVLQTKVFDALSFLSTLKSSSPT